MACSHRCVELTDFLLFRSLCSSSLTVSLFWHSPMVLRASRAEPEQPCRRSSAPSAACRKLFFQMFLVNSGTESATTARRSSSVWACSSDIWLPRQTEEIMITNQKRWSLVPFCRAHGCFLFCFVFHPTRTYWLLLVNALTSGNSAVRQVVTSGALSRAQFRHRRQGKDVSGFLLETF